MARKSTRSLWTSKIRLGIVQDKRTSSPKQPPAMVEAKQSRERITGYVLGVDPSLRATGLAIVHFKKDGTYHFVKSHTIRLDTDYSFSDCMGAIFQSVNDFIANESIVAAAFEETIYVQNFQIAQKLGAARGAAMAAVSLAEIPIGEYPPLRVKQAVVGYGRASKDQVAHTVGQLLNLPKSTPLPSDEADAVAVALCHGLTYSNPLNALR